MRTEKVFQFRQSKEPISAEWTSDKFSYFGSLIWRDHQPILQLIAQFDSDEMFEDDKNVPFLEATKPPNELSFLGVHPSYSNITLTNCMRFYSKRNYNIQSKKATYTLEFVPQEIWIGSNHQELSTEIVSAVGRDIRLTGFFGEPGLDTIDKYDSDKKSIIEALGNPKEIWTWSGPNKWLLTLGDTGFTLGINTSVLSQMSSTTGHTLQSTVDIHIHSGTPSSIEEYQKQFYKIEQILSVYSIENFTFQSLEFQGIGNLDISLVWQYGSSDDDVFKPPMSHQILADLSDRDIFQRILNDWFDSNETMELSRWLFARALEETQSGLARFVATAQAFEVLGREMGPRKKKNKELFKKQVKKFSDLIEGQFDEEFTQRTIGLVRSSNSTSYKDVLRHIIGDALEFYKYSDRTQIEPLIKEITDMRNTIVHMSDNDDGKLDTAFGNVNKRSMLLCFFYSLVQAYRAKVPIESVERFLVSNRNARMALNYDYLEELK